MGKTEREVPVYIFTGMIDSGKTTLIKEIIKENNFLEDGNTLMVLCEEGEIVLDSDFLKKNKIDVEVLESEEDLTNEFWINCEKKYAPHQVLIEYNGMWKIESFLEGRFPKGWGVGGIYSSIDATTAEMYLLNMRNIFMDAIKYSNFVLINRCTDSFDRQKFRRNIKVLNPNAELIFERENGEPYTAEEESLPYSYEKSPVVIDDLDFGIWYLDAQEHPERYVGKEIKFKGRFCASEREDAKLFIPGRHVMTCCADDIQFLGFVCFFEGELPYKHGDWIEVTVNFEYKYCKIYREKGPVLKLVSISESEPCTPELITFS